MFIWYADGDVQINQHQARIEPIWITNPRITAPYLTSQVLGRTVWMNTLKDMEQEINSAKVVEHQKPAQGRLGRLTWDLVRQKL